MSMAPPKLLFFFIIFLGLILFHIMADHSVQGSVEADETVDFDDSDSSALNVELDILKSRVQILESQVKEKLEELKKKDEVITQKGKIIQDNSDSISSLQNEIESLQKKGTLDAEEQVGKAHAHAGELERQVQSLKRELEAQKKKKAALETRVNEAEKKILDVNAKLESLRKINGEQKTKIHKTERALGVVEEEMVKAKFEATSKTKELMEVHGAWLPPWLAVHLIHCQSFMEAHWNKHGQPALDAVVWKALDKKALVQKWAEPHVETIKTKWVPVVKEQWIAVKTNAEPHVELLTVKTIEFYETFKSTINSYGVQLLVVVNPYFQEVRKFSKPYTDQVAAVTKPHVERVRVALNPHTKKVVHAFGKFLKSATTYHHQVQATVKEVLKKHELTRPLATKEFEWFAASAILALPIFMLARILSSTRCKKTKKSGRNAHTGHG